MPSTNRKKIIRTAAVPSSLYGLLNGQLKFLNQHYEIIGVASKGPLMQELEKREGIRTATVAIERNISPIKDLRAVIDLYRLFKKEKPFMVHSITPKAGLVSMMAAYFASVPKRAHTFTGLIFPTRNGIMKQLLLFFDSLICGFATHIYPEGNGVKNDLIAYKVTSKPLKIIANGNVNGVDLDWFNPELYTKEARNLLRSSLEIPNDAVVFVYVGRLVNDKGITELVDAFSKITDTHTKAYLILVGSHEGETDILPSSTWEKIDTIPKIVCVGQQTDVRPYLAISNVFVFPSYREGFPNVVLEAGAMGLPSIVTDINGSNEIISHNHNGFIVPSKDTNALFEALQAFLEKPDLRERLALESRKNIVVHYERNFVWNALLAEYKKIESE